MDSENTKSSSREESAHKESSGRNGWKYAVCGAAVTALAAPIAVPALLSVAGFTGGGIAAGSTAASMMASYGGAVSSGSVVAVCQSIGAAGLGAKGVAVASCAGGTVMAGVRRLRE